VTVPDQHPRRVTDRAVFGVCSIIRRYRLAELGFQHVVGGIEAQISSLVEIADAAWVEEWRSHWNQLEYVNAMMIDERRDAPTPDEQAIVDGALDALEHMTERWTQLDALERAVLEKLVAGDTAPLEGLQRQLACCRVGNREGSGVGFFSTLVVDREEAESIGDTTARLGDVSADIDGLAHGAGFLLTISAGYLDQLEGYSFDEPWPEQIDGFSLSYTKEPRDLAVLQ
jgi:hypothetical protein